MLPSATGGRGIRRRQGGEGRGHRLDRCAKCGHATPIGRDPKGIAGHAADLRHDGAYRLLVWMSWLEISFDRVAKVPAGREHARVLAGAVAMQRRGRLFTGGDKSSLALVDRGRDATLKRAGIEPEL